MINVRHGYGFDNYPRTYDFNNGIQFNIIDDWGALTVPQVVKYGVDHPDIIGTCYQNILGAFCDAMNDNNIKPCFYYPLGHSVNHRGRPNNPPGYAIGGGYDGSGNYRTGFYDDFKTRGDKYAIHKWSSFTGTWAQYYYKWISYVRADLKHLIETYDPWMLWFDNSPAFPLGWMNEIYQYCKKIKPLILIGQNVSRFGGTPSYWAGTNTQFGPINFVDIYRTNWQNYAFPPCDFASIEYKIAEFAGDPITEYQPNCLHNGINYYMPSEYLESVYDGGYWYITGKGSLRSQAEIQAFYDVCKARDVRCNIGLSPDTNGTIEAGQISLISNLTL